MAWTRNRRIYAVLLVAGVFGVVAFLALKPRGDSIQYNGSPLRVWALKAAAGDPQGMAAIRAMGPEAVPGLVDLLQRKDSFVKRQAGRASLDSPRWARKLFGRWVENIDVVAYRTAAAKTLAFLGPEARAAVPALIKALHDPHTQVSWEAALALGKVGQPAVPELMRALTDPNAFVRSCAVYALGQAGAAAEPALPALIERFTDTNREVRAGAAYSVGLIGVPSMIALSNTLYHGDSQARTAAVQELVRFQRALRVPIPALAKMARAEDSASREMAVSALGNLRLGDNTTMEVLTNALVDAAPEVRVAAVKGLKLIPWRTHEALPQLTEKFQDSSAAVREWSINTIADLGPRAAPALSELRRLAENDPAYRQLATQAIARIQASP